MPSQFFGLNTAYTGLLAANAGLNTTANNISNLETRGYSRQQVKQQAYEALRTFTTYGSAGAGVEVLAIERLRDEFYDVKYWNNNSYVGEYNTKAYYMKQFEEYFADTKDIEGFTTIFNKMYASLADLKNDAGNSTKKQQFISMAAAMADYFNSMAGNLDKMQSDMNNEVNIQISHINTIAAQIASLNQQINVIEMSGGVASELRDQRGVLVDDLSQIVSVTVEETPITDPHNEGRKTGGNNYVVKIAGGQTLVNGAEYRSLTCVARATHEKVNQSDVDGLYDVYWQGEFGDFDKATAEPFNLYAGNVGGQLKSLMEMRDGNNSEFFNGKISGIGSVAIGGKDYDTVKIDVTQAHLLDINKLTLSDSGGMINLGNQMFYYDSWSYDEATKSYTFVLSDSTKNPEKIDNSRIGREASVGRSVDYKGVPYYQEQMNEWVRDFANTFNDILGEGVDSYNNPGSKLFAAKDVVNGGDLTFNDNVTGGFDVTSDSYYRLTAKNFKVSELLIADPELLATHTEENAGDSKYDILDKLIDLKDNKDLMNFRGASCSQFLHAILGDIALNAGSANLFKSNYNNIGDSIDIQRLSVSGVDKDEEAVNITKYQHAYTLSSKMIQVLTEVYDQLILNTGV